MDKNRQVSNVGVWRAKFKGEIAVRADQGEPSVVGCSAGS